MTNEQALALARLIEQRTPREVTIEYAPFELPDGYLLVSLASYRMPLFTCGIAPNGDVSS